MRNIEKPMSNIFKTTVLLAAVLLMPGLARSQSTITFQVNLKPQIEDSVFVPGRDVIEISGNLAPISLRGIVLKDVPPQDSIYTVEIDFPYSTTGKKLTYRFKLKLESGTVNEKLARNLDLNRGKQTLPALYFDSYAW